MSIQIDNGGTGARMREQGREKGHPILGSDLCLLHIQPPLRQHLLAWFREVKKVLYSATI